MCRASLLSMPCYPSLSSLFPSVFQMQQNHIASNESYLVYSRVSYNTSPWISVTLKWSELQPSSLLASLGITSSISQSYFFLPTVFVSISFSAFLHNHFSPSTSFLLAKNQIYSGSLSPDHPSIYFYKLFSCFGLFRISHVLFWIGHSG